MDNSEVKNEARQKTLEMFYSDLANYRKRDRKFFEESGLQDPMWYYNSPPPYPVKFKDMKDWKDKVYGSHPRLDSRLILLPNYILFLTEWTPEKASETKRMTAGSFLGSMVKEGISELSLGISDLAEMGFSKLAPGQAMKLLGKNPEEMLSNPWSWIINLEDIAEYRLEKSGFLYHYLYLHANHRFEGEMHLGVTYHSGGMHSRADDLYKKLDKLKNNYS